MDRCDVSGCTVIGYSVSVDATPNFSYHFCQAHYDDWGEYLSKQEETQPIKVRTTKWIRTIEQFLKEAGGQTKC